MHRVFILSLAALMAAWTVFLGGAGPAKAQQLIVNGGFEVGPVVYDTTNYTGFTLPGWTGVGARLAKGFGPARVGSRP